MSKVQNKVCTTFNYIEHFVILVSTNTGHNSIPDSSALISMPIGIKIYDIGLKNYGNSCRN